MLLITVNYNTLYPVSDLVKVNEADAVLFIGHTTVAIQRLLYSTLFTISGREKNNNRKIHMYTHTHTHTQTLNNSQ